MFFYFLLLALIIILTVLIKNKKLLVAIILIVLVTVYTLRSKTVGWDTESYVTIFKESPSIDVSSHYMEPGWLYLNKVIYFISPTQAFFFFVIGFVSLSIAFFVFSKTSQNVGLSIIIFFMLCYFTRLMNTQRNDLAVYLCMLSFYCLYRKKIIPAVAFNILAITIHKSAFVFFLFIIVDFFIKKFTKRTLVLAIFVTIVVFLLFTPIFSFFTKYLYGGYSDKTNETESGGLRFFIVYTLLFVFVLVADRVKIRNTFFFPDNTNETRLNKLLYTAICFSLFFQLLSIKNAMVARFSNYFFAYYPVVIANSIYSIRKKGSLTMRSLIPTVFAVLLVWMVLNLQFAEGGFGKDKVIPYVIELSNNCIL